MEKWEKDLERNNYLRDEFLDTCKMCQENPQLVCSVAASLDQQSVILETDMLEDMAPDWMAGRVEVSAKTALEAAACYGGITGKKTAVLDFASALSPGGNSYMGGDTQEECLMRESTLYPCLNTPSCEERFYAPHKALSKLYNADLVYTPGVKVVKQPVGKELYHMPELRWFDVDVITMAAPNLALYRETAKSHPHLRHTYGDDAMLRLFEERFTRIMQAAALHSVDILILGAFGCGECGNDPAIVATAAARALEKFPRMFDVVEFAVPTAGSKKNYRMFRLVLDRYTGNH